jgi:hypothetical protein
MERHNSRQRSHIAASWIRAPSVEKEPTGSLAHHYGLRRMTVAWSRFQTTRADAPLGPRT